MRKCDAEIGLIGLQQVISRMSERRYSSKKARFRSVKDRHVTKLEKKNAVYCDATEVACNIRHFSFIPR